MDLAVNTLLVQPFPNELRVIRAVFEIENVKFLVHACSPYLMISGGASLKTAQNAPNVFIASMNSWKSTGLTT